MESRLWAGQSAHILCHTWASELLEELVFGVSAMLDNTKRKD